MKTLVPIRHVVTIPNWHPPSLNRLLGMHWAVRAKRKKADAALVAAYCLLAEVPRARGKRRVTVRLTLAHRDRRMDDDNWRKYPLDALVRCGALVDDGPDWVECRPLEFERGKQRRTIITLEDLP